MTTTQRFRSALAIAAVLVLGACAGGGGDAGDDTAGSDRSVDASAATAAPAPTRCDWELNTVGFWEQEPPVQAEAHQHGHEGNEHGVQAWRPITDAQQCRELAASVDAMEQVAERYPVAQDALDAGCFMATVFVPGIAAHYYCLANMRSGTDLERPTMLLYGGTAPTAPIVGLSYMVYEPDAPDTNADAPLWVRYMPWHYHEALCLKGGLVIGGDHSDPARCEAAGGRIQGRTGWMGHYWLPTCPSPDGVFSAANPRLDGGVAAFNDDAVNATRTAWLGANPCRGSAMPVDPRGGDRFGAPGDDVGA